MIKKPGAHIIIIKYQGDVQRKKGALILTKQKLTVEQVKKMFDPDNSGRIDTLEVNGDIIGRIGNSDFLSYWRHSNEKWEDFGQNKLETIFKSWIEDEDKQRAIMNAVMDVCTNYQTQGFREGFNIALNIIIQGMTFPTWPT